MYVQYIPRTPTARSSIEPSIRAAIIIDKERGNESNSDTHNAYATAVASKLKNRGVDNTINNRMDFLT